MCTRTPYYARILEDPALLGALDGCGAEGYRGLPTASWTRWHGKRGPYTRAAWSRQALPDLGLDGAPARTNQDRLSRSDTARVCASRRPDA
jgi:hypothetical protein